MKLAVFDTHAYDHEALAAANGRYGHELTFLEPRLTRHTASLAAGFPAVCSFVNDHVPLTPTTHHLIDAAALAQMKRGVMLINTGRGALVDSRALIDALERGHVGAAGLDVYEEEEGIFFRNLSDQVLQDDVLARLLTFPNVLITSHQAFLTREALANIAHTTLTNVSAFERGEHLSNEVRAEQVLKTVPER
jgi:D-lactate dehydrogenase